MRAHRSGSIYPRKPQKTPFQGSEFSRLIGGYAALPTRLYVCAVLACCGEEAQSTRLSELSDERRGGWYPPRGRDVNMTSTSDLLHLDGPLFTERGEIIAQRQ